MSRVLLVNADARRIPLADESVDCIVTSPPYWGLRDYGDPRQLGLEPRPDCLGWATGERCGACYVCGMVAVFRELRRVLKRRGTAWLNLGDSYAGAAATGYRPGAVPGSGGDQHGARNRNGVGAVPGLKPKDLVMVPHRVALALQADGWWVRSDIVWAKPNPMPESVRDRPTKAHEFVFLLARSDDYFFDAEAVAEQGQGRSSGRVGEDKAGSGAGFEIRSGFAKNGATEWHTRNIRSVWTIASRPYSGAHFATMPPDLAERCIKAGCPVGGTVLDPFGGSGTTAMVAARLGRNAVLLDCNRGYLAEQATARTSDLQIELGVG